MCGITGYWEAGSASSADSMRSLITSMTHTMVRRGPDSAGAWINPKQGLALGHRRLAIRDLTQTGHQPMTSLCGRYVLTYNGEIFNAEELRETLSHDHGIKFRGTSDTEVILHGCAVWGVEATAKRLIGMFAFAFWNGLEKTLTLVRDRLGIKPLYWGKFGRLFLFGSELKPLCRHPGWPKQINRNAVGELMRCCYISAPLSIYEGIAKLRPGYLLEVSADGSIRGPAFWDARQVMRAGTAQRFSATDQQLIQQLEELLRDSVKRRMIADVPLGAFLSGGIDSSLVAALMQAQSSSPIRTFSIGFEEAEYNEAPYAKAVAKHLGTCHTEEIMTSRQAWAIIPRLAEFYDEPFGDSSQLPTYLLCGITRKHVAVALSGDGGDELFAGYERYFHFLKKFPESEFPQWKKIVVQSMAAAFSEENWDQLIRFIPGRLRPARFGYRLHGLARRSRLNPSALYRQIALGHWPDPLAVAIGAQEMPSIFDDEKLEAELKDPVERMQFLDSVNYLPDDILVKVDRASMAVSLEARVPLIDHRIFEFTWKLSPSMRVRSGQSKWILRQILYKYVPKELVDRPKMGFGVPIDHWLRGSLKDWAGALLDPVRLRREGYLNPDIITSIWQKHLNRDGDYHYWLWDALMFQAWHESKDEPVTVPPGAQMDISIAVSCAV